jgi:hypothetical protein
MERIQLEAIKIHSFLSLLHVITIKSKYNKTILLLNLLLMDLLINISGIKISTPKIQNKKCLQIFHDHLFQVIHPKMFNSNCLIIICYIIIAMQFPNDQIQNISNTINIFLHLEHSIRQFFLIPFPDVHFQLFF